MINWIQIDPLMSLPQGEVLATNADGAFILGELQRFNMANIVCIGSHEEIKRVTHYCLPTRPQKEKLSLMEKATMSLAPDLLSTPIQPQTIDHIKNQAAIASTYTHPPKLDYNLALKTRRREVFKSSGWSIFIEEIRKLPLWMEHQMSDIGVPYIKTSKQYMYILKTYGMVRSAGWRKFVIIKEIPQGMRCVVKPKEEEIFK